MITDTNYFWFRLFETQGIGTKTLVNIARLLTKHGISSSEIPLSKNELSTKLPDLAKIILSKIHKNDQERIYNEYRSLLQEDIEIIHPESLEYPSNFLSYAEKLNISPVLYAQGNSKLLDSDGIGIAGARNVSQKGIEATRKIAADLAFNGYNVVSGYAKGVDSEAHLGALNAGGTTTFVLSYGIREFRRKRDFKEINWAKDTLAISQFKPTTKWLARNAMARNKLICALSQGVIIIEAGAEKDNKGRMSGTFNTGKTTLEMNLPLFVVSPGYFDVQPVGNSILIKKGGIEIDPQNGVKDIINYIKKSSSRLTQNSQKKPGEIIRQTTLPV